MIGLKRGTVALHAHDPAWKLEANRVIDQLYKLLRRYVVDIQHVGSTAIASLHAKPIIDIAVAVESFDSIDTIRLQLETNGLQFLGEDVPGQYLFGIGNGEVRTHHIHFVLCNSTSWINYINFRDYLNMFAERASEYDALKLHLSTIYASDRSSYTRGKQEFIARILEEAKVWRYESNYLINT